MLGIETMEEQIARDCRMVGHRFVPIREKQMTGRQICLRCERTQPGQPIVVYPGTADKAGMAIVPPAGGSSMNSNV